VPTPQPTPQARPIGVFDSGVGGLTVARALMDLLPDERIIYFGDTARGPYGPRDLHEVRRFTAELVEFLAGEGTKLVVAACNTATAAALDPEAGDPAADFPVPVVGVIQPAVDAAVAATRNGRVGVIGTVGTVASGAYDRAVAAAAPDVHLVSQACPRFVQLVEAGRTTDRDVLAIAAAYLEPLRAAGVDTLILGCTHYPLLTGVLSYVMGPEVVLVSSAEETARKVFALLVHQDLMAPGPRGRHRFVSSGDGSVFADLATRFLGPRLSTVEVHPAGGHVRQVTLGAPTEGAA
jgi:glutamate racemase